MLTVVGVTDEQDSCDCCGKSNLKRTVVLRTEEGTFVFYGTTCASVATGRAAKDITSAAKTADKVRAQALQSAVNLHPLQASINAEIDAANAAGMPFAVRQASGMTARVRAMQSQIQAEAEATIMAQFGRV